MITLKLTTGFFMQDKNGDGDPSTSDGIFVCGGVTSAIVGDLVRVKGTVAEFKPGGASRTVTELQDVTSIVTLSCGHSITPTPLSMPTDLARFEGMLMRFINFLLINQVSSLAERGEMTLASVRREVPTNRYAAGSAGALQLAATRSTRKCSIGSPPTFSVGNCRGADSVAEFMRQRDKIVNELVALDADVVGLMEIQNNGDDALSYLLDSVNANLGAVIYATVPKPPSTGSDAIRVAMIYKPAVLALSGLPAGVTLANQGGVHSGLPIIAVGHVNSTVAPGASITVQFYGGVWRRRLLRRCSHFQRTQRHLRIAAGDCPSRRADKSRLTAHRRHAMIC